MTDPDTFCPICEMPVYTVGEKVLDFFTNQDSQVRTEPLPNSMNKNKQQVINPRGTN